MRKQETLLTINRVFEVLGNPLKFKIFLKILEEGCDCDIKEQTGLTGNCVSGLMKELNLPQSTVSMYLKDLEAAEIIVCEKNGKFLYCKPNKTMMITLKSFIDSAVKQIKS